jgi:hypothetical protein
MENAVFYTLIVVGVFVCVIYRLIKRALARKDQRKDTGESNGGSAPDPRLLPFDKNATVISSFFPLIALWVLGLRRKYNRHAAVGDWETANECVRKVAKVKTWWFIPLCLLAFIIGIVAIVQILLLIDSCMK